MDNYTKKFMSQHSLFGAEIDHILIAFNKQRQQFINNCCCDQLKNALHKGNIQASQFKAEVDYRIFGIPQPPPPVQTDPWEEEHDFGGFRKEQEADFTRGTERIKITFCPFCGRKLNIVNKAARKAISEKILFGPAEEDPLTIANEIILGIRPKNWNVAGHPDHDMWVSVTAEMVVTKPST
jgi:hypothetical protein